MELLIKKIKMKNIIYLVLFIPSFVFSQGKGDFIEITGRTSDTLVNADTIVYDFDYDFVSEWGSYLTFQTQRTEGAGGDTVILETFVSNSKPKATPIWVVSRIDTILGTGTQTIIIDYDIKARRVRYLIRKTTANKSTKIYLEGVLRRKRY